MVDSLGKGEIGVLLAGSSDIVGLALLAEVACPGRITADADVGGQVAEWFALVHDDGAQARVHDIGGLVEARLQFVLRPSMVSIRASNGADKGGMVHLL